MEFVKKMCDEARWVYDPATAVREGRLRFSVGKRMKRIGKKDTRQEFYHVAHYRPKSDEDPERVLEEITIDEPVVCYGNTTDTFKAWKSEVYRGNDVSQSDSVAPSRKMTFFTESPRLKDDFALLYEEMNVKPKADAWHVTSPIDYCNRALMMLEMEGVEVSSDEREDAEALMNKLSGKQRESLKNSIMNYIRSSAYSFERTEKTGKLDATYIRRKDQEMGLSATLPIVMGYDDKKRKYEVRDAEMDVLNFGYLEMFELAKESPFQVEEYGSKDLESALIHGGRDVNNTCVRSEDAAPDRYACVAIKHGTFYFKTETSFAPQKHVRWLLRMPKLQRNADSGGVTASSILRGMPCVVKPRETDSDGSIDRKPNDHENGADPDLSE
ncbi:hypothetical protein CYMTET_35732 [Cymbomonas tetramitiformis]|uniref:Uncharacterized protein n=1 Tax=Cymbomonas tetramitiformis TaxID=36881 RepID=A0AAE0F8Q5_9CHLO|nr:hypothetical protein CYMTET_35732 [Cymbomonas tetramitiformis]|eukprot:gene185-325_t